MSCQRTYGVTDLDRIVKTWAERRTGKEGDDYAFKLDWENTRFYVNGEPQFHNKTKSPDVKSYVAFQSAYQNDTNEAHSHTFQMTGSTEASVMTHVTEGFSRNGRIELEIDVPPYVSQMTGSFGSYIKLPGEGELKTTHSMNWSVNSVVKVPPKSRTVAELKIEESVYECSFTVYVHICGTVLVRIHDITSDNHTVVQGDIATILREAVEMDRVRQDIEIRGRKIIWKMSGFLNFKYGFSQDVHVWNKTAQ